MGPLGFVNWRSVNRGFCGLMWAVVLVLAMVVLTHTGGGSAAHHLSIVRR